MSMIQNETVVRAECQNTEKAWLLVWEREEKKLKGRFEEV